jgi:hypothetical protein
MPQFTDVTITGTAGAALDVPITAGTAAARAVQVAGVYTSPPLALTAGQSASMQLDAAGNLLVNVKAGGSGDIQFADNVASGATPTGTLAAGWDSVNSKVRALKSDASQNLNINVAASTLNDPAECAVGTATAPTKILIVGGKSADGTPVYNPVPLAAGSGSVVISGAVTLASTTITGTVAVTESGNFTSRIVGNSGATLDGTIAAGTAPTNAIGTLVQYSSSVPALTAAQTVSMQCDSTGSVYVNPEVRKATYSMSTSAFIPKASATSPSWSIQGSSTKTIRILRIVATFTALTGTATPFYTNLQLQKYSVLSGGVTGTTPTGALNDSNNAAQTAIVLTYSTVPSTATAIGGITRAEIMQVITATASLNAASRVEWDFGNIGGQALILRGTAQYFGLVIPTIAASTPLMAVWVEFTEE